MLEGIKLGVLPAGALAVILELPAPPELLDAGLEADEDEPPVALLLGMMGTGIGVMMGLVVCVGVDVDTALMLAKVVTGART